MAVYPLPSQFGLGIYNRVKLVISMEVIANILYQTKSGTTHSTRFGVKEFKTEKALERDSNRHYHKHSFVFTYLLYRYKLKVVT